MNGIDTMLRGLVILLAVAACCMLGVEGGRKTTKAPYYPKKCPEGSFPSYDECYEKCSKDYSQY